MVQIKHWHIQVATGFAVLAIPIFLLLHMYYQYTATMDFPFVPMTTIPELILDFPSTFSSSTLYYFIMFLLSLAGVTVIMNGIYSRYVSRLTLESANQIRRKFVRMGIVFVSSFVGVVLLILAAMGYYLSMVDYESDSWYECFVPNNCVMLSEELHLGSMYVALSAAIMCGIAACVTVIHLRSNDMLGSNPKAIK